MEFRDSTGQLIRTKSMPLFTTPQAQKVTRRKVDFIVKCIDCSKPERIHDYPGKWKTGDYRCEKCFDIWYAKQPPIELKLYDMMTNELVATRTYER